MTEFSFSKLLKSRVPVLKWLPVYKPKDALGDLVAGLTVGLTLIPQVLSTLHNVIPATRVIEMLHLI